MIPPPAIGPMSSNRVILGQLLSSRARLRFPGQPHPAATTPARRDNLSERHTRTSQTVSLQGSPQIQPRNQSNRQGYED